MVLGLKSSAQLIRLNHSRTAVTTPLLRLFFDTHSQPRMTAYDHSHFTGWKQIGPGLEEYCQTRREERLEAKRRRARGNRTRKARCLYDEHRSGILPSEWLYLPTPEQAAQLSWCSELIERPLDVQVVDSDFATPLTNLPASIEAWVRERRDEHIAMLPEEYRSAFPPTISMVPTALTASSVDDIRRGRCRGDLRPFLGPLELAMAVFEPQGEIFALSCNAKIVVAKDVCNTWKQNLYPLEFSSRGSEAVVQMLELAGLDPKTTAAVDFDAVDHRFLCLNCFGANNDSWVGVKAETWRSAVRILLQDSYNF